MKIGNLEIDLGELSRFIGKAKRECYAGDGEERKLVDGSKVLTFQEGDFHYTDDYSGFYQAPGNEIVRWQRPEGQRIWQMNYSGGMLNRFWGNRELAKETFSFLKEALLEISPELPLRGSSRFESDDFVYLSDVEGDLVRFKGDEEIYSENLGKTVFSQDFSGGLIIPK